MEGMKSCEIRKKERNETDGWMGGRERERETNRGRWYDKRERKIVIIYSVQRWRRRKRKNEFRWKKKKKRKKLEWAPDVLYVWLRDREVRNVSMESSMYETEHGTRLVFSKVFNLKRPTGNAPLKQVHIWHIWQYIPRNHNTGPFST